MKIIKADQITSKESIILIARKDNSFTSWIKVKQDKDYLKFCLDQKKKQFLFNRYPQWIFVHIIDEEKTDIESLEETRKAGRIISDLVNSRKLKSLVITDLEGNKNHLMAFAEGMALSNYQFNKYLNKKEEKQNSLGTLKIFSKNISKQKIDELDRICRAVYWTRNLVNEPLSTLTAVELSREIEKMGKEAGFAVEVFHKKKIESLRMGGLLAVNKGSIDPPTFSILTWKPAKAKNKKPIVLVGKGVVYDTGGLSLKPTHDSMDYMKCDMAGAAAVAGTLYALAKNKVPVHVIGLIPATDNRPDGNAYVPGDVVRMFDGTTVEVLNTDAEGRMILGDALAWADKLDPSLVLDVATLTGSAHAAIGKYGIVAMGNADRKEMESLKDSGESVFERIAEFPFWNEYSELLKSDIADLKNIGGRYAGAITAGKFLEHFTKSPYIHLDIAGPSYNKLRDSYRGIGGSGIGVRLLYDFLKKQ
ncbi:MAG TPA: leucyl aminopeptidase [Bacteroides sp.]|nr:leucyl aminopeptidase [Bacteroides sp.]